MIMYRSSNSPVVATVIFLTTLLCFILLISSSPLVVDALSIISQPAAKLSIPSTTTPKNVPTTSNRGVFRLFQKRRRNFNNKESSSLLGSSIAQDSSSASASNKDVTTTTTTKSKAMYAVPSIFTPNDSRPIVLFDGKCNLCNFGVQLLLDYDRASDDKRGNLRVAALQSRVGKILLDRMPDDVRNMVLKPSSVAKRSDDRDDIATNIKDDNVDWNDENEEEENYKSIVVCSSSKTWVNTAAVLRMGRAMKFPFRPIALIAYLIPPFIRDRLYGVVSKTRKLMFGERDECRLWDDNWDQRFVDDTVLGGQGSSNTDDDPFADPNAPPVEEESPTPVDVKIGDKVRVVSPTPVMSNYVPSHPEGICVSGCIGKVVRESPMMVEFNEEELFGTSSEDAVNVADSEKKIRAYVRSDQIVEVSFE